MIEFFNDLLNAYNTFVNALFNDLIFYGDIPVGYIIVALMCMGFIITYFLGRLR